MAGGNLLFLYIEKCPVINVISGILSFNQKRNEQNKHGGMHLFMSLTHCRLTDSLELEMIEALHVPRTIPVAVP